MDEQRRYWIVRNSNNFECRRCRRLYGRGTVHEYFTSGCRPVLFNDPSEWFLIRRKLATDAPGMDLSSVPFGEPEEIGEREAAALNPVRVKARREVDWHAVLARLTRAGRYDEQAVNDAIRRCSRGPVAY